MDTDRAFEQVEMEKAEVTGPSADVEAAEKQKQEDARVQTLIVEKIRTESEKSAKLTRFDSLVDLEPDLKPEYIKKMLSEIEIANDYQDIQTVSAPNGNMYLYSTLFITGQYADILSRVEADDKCDTIAMTVRDDSKIYPRLTRIEYFLVPPFSIKQEELEAYISRTLESDKYKDIKLFIASTGAHFLYSNLYISDTYAKNMAEWEEVEQFDNP